MNEYELELLREIAQKELRRREAILCPKDSASEDSCRLFSDTVDDLRDRGLVTFPVSRILTSNSFAAGLYLAVRDCRLTEDGSRMLVEAVK